MRIGKIRSLRGPNIYNYKPVMVMDLYLEEWSGKESKDIEGFNTMLIDALPGLWDHHCSRGKVGGFVERLGEGTYLSHIIEHVALELMSMVDMKVSYGKTKFNDEWGCYEIAVEYDEEETTRFLLQSAVELVAAIASLEVVLVKPYLDKAKRIYAQNRLGISTKSLIEAAMRRNIPCTRIGNESLFRLGYGIYSKYVEATITSDTSATAVDISCNKDITKKILYQAGIPVPQGMIVTSAKEAVESWTTLGVPVVVKPLDASKGNGVSIDISSGEEVMRAFEKAKIFYPEVIVEEYFHGNDYRILVVDGQVVAASHRIPARVLGDGKSTIEELVRQVNQDPLRGEGHDNILTKISMDDSMKDFLKKKGMSFQTVPAWGQWVSLIDTANLSTGGVAVDVTDRIHPDIRLMCERAARAVRLNVCGIDLICKEISRPLHKAGGIVEINSAPGIRMHEYPTYGQKQPVADAIIDMMYKKHEPSRIPIISITGTNGKTTVGRMIDHVLRSNGKITGLTGTDGITIGGKTILKGDMTGRYSAEVVLSDPTVEVAVLETARGGIVHAGLGYDWSDVAVLTNIQHDHIGQDGIQSIDDLIWIKSLVAERVKENGSIILNADDEHTARLAESRRILSLPRNIVYFSLDEKNPYIQKHIHEGKTVFYVSKGWIIEESNFSSDFYIQTKEIPATFNGWAGFNVSNILASIAACRAIGLGKEEILSHLNEFDPNQHNLGRANLFKYKDSYIFVDYGHNPEALKSVLETAKNFKRGRLIGVIGLPGDRENSIIEESARIAANGFDHVIIKEDEDLRGRSRGETAGIIVRTIKSINSSVTCEIILDEKEAIRKAVSQLYEGDVLMIFYEKLESIKECFNHAEFTRQIKRELPEMVRVGEP